MKCVDLQIHLSTVSFQPQMNLISNVKCTYIRATFKDLSKFVFVKFLHIRVL